MITELMRDLSLLQNSDLFWKIYSPHLFDTEKVKEESRHHTHKKTQGTDIGDR
jgi:hypothetical protein